MLRFVLQAFDLSLEHGRSLAIAPRAQDSPRFLKDRAKMPDGGFGSLIELDENHEEHTQ